MKLWRPNFILWGFVLIGFAGNLVFPNFGYVLVCCGILQMILDCWHYTYEK